MFLQTMFKNCKEVQLHGSKILRNVWRLKTFAQDYMCQRSLFSKTSALQWDDKCQSYHLHCKNCRFDKVFLLYPKFSFYKVKGSLVVLEDGITTLLLYFTDHSSHILDNSSIWFNSFGGCAATMVTSAWFIVMWNSNSLTESMNRLMENRVRHGRSWS